MSINVTAQLQVDIQTAFETFSLMRNEVRDLSNLYWKGGVSTDLSAVSGGSDPVTQTTKLTKDQLISALSLIEELDDFFDNDAVAQSDYLTTIETNIHGKATPTLISPAVEAFGDRSVQLCQDALTQYNRSRDIENWYNSSEISAYIGSVSTQKIIDGSDMTKDDLTSAITLIQQFQRMLENLLVTAGDYKVTLGKWARF